MVDSIRQEFNVRIAEEPTLFELEDERPDSSKEAMNAFKSAVQSRSKKLEKLLSDVSKLSKKLEKIDDEIGGDKKVTLQSEFTAYEQKLNDLGLVLKNQCADVSDMEKVVEAYHMLYSNGVHFNRTYLDRYLSIAAAEHLRFNRPKEFAKCLQWDSLKEIGFDAVTTQEGVKSDVLQTIEDGMSSLFGRLTKRDIKSSGPHWEFLLGFVDELLTHNLYSDDLKPQLSLVSTLMHAATRSIAEVREALETLGLDDEGNPRDDASDTELQPLLKILQMDKMGQALVSNAAEAMQKRSKEFEVVDVFAKMDAHSEWFQQLQGEWDYRNEEEMAKLFEWKKLVTRASTLADKFCQEDTSKQVASYKEALDVALQKFMRAAVWRCMFDVLEDAETCVRNNEDNAERGKAVAGLVGGLEEFEFTDEFRELLSLDASVKANDFAEIVQSFSAAITVLVHPACEVSIFEQALGYNYDEAKAISPDPPHDEGWREKVNRVQTVVKEAGDTQLDCLHRNIRDALCRHYVEIGAGKACSLDRVEGIKASIATTERVMDLLGLDKADLKSFSLTFQGKRSN